MVMKRFLAIALAGLMVVTSAGTGNIKAYAKSDDPDVISISESVEEESAEDEIADALGDILIEEDFTVKENSEDTTAEEAANEEAAAEEAVEEAAEEAEVASDIEVEDQKAATDALYLNANGGKFPDGKTVIEADIWDYSWLNRDYYIPLKDGKVFCGWYAEEACTTCLSSDDDMYCLKEQPAGGTTIYAKYSDYWTVTVEYGTENGTDPIKNMGYLWDTENEVRIKSHDLKVAKGFSIYTVYNSANYLNGYIRNEDYSYEFDWNWYSDFERQNKMQYSDSYIPTGNTTIYAGFRKLYHLITVHAGEDGYFTRQVNDFDEKVGEYQTTILRIADYGQESDTYSVYKSSLEYYLYNKDIRKTIKGYYFDESLKNALEFSEYGESAPFSKDVTDIYVEWESTKTAITFDTNADNKAYIRHWNSNKGDYEKVTKLELLNYGDDYYDIGEVISDDLHWKFLGWSQKKDATTPEVEQSYEGVRLSGIDSTKDYTFYAVWDKDANLVATFDAGEEGYFEYEEDGETKRTDKMYKSVEVWSEGYGYVDVYNYKPLCKDSKKVFEQYTVEGKGLGSNYSYKMTKDTTFTATYVKPFTVTLDANAEKGGYFVDDDGKHVATKTLYGTGVIGLYIPEPENDGDYSFDKWYEDSDRKIPAYVDYSRFYPEKDIVLYGDWSKNCTITFDPGEGTLSGTASFKRPEGETIGDYWFDPPIATPGDSSKVFVAWFTDKNFAESSRVKTSEIKDLIVKGDTTFYAKYATAYDVTFDVGTKGAFVNKSGTTWTVKVPEGESLGSRVPTVKSTDEYVFRGWFTEATGGTKIENLYDYKVTKTATLYGQYTDCYVITFNANMEGATLDGSKNPVKVCVPKGQPYSYYTEGKEKAYSYAPYLDYEGVDTKGKIPLITSNGYGSLAWTTSKDGAGDKWYFSEYSVYRVDSEGKNHYFGNKGFVPTDNMEFWAVWSDTVTVTFDAGTYTFNKEDTENGYYGERSDDGHKLVLKVPSGIFFYDINTPYSSYIDDAPEKMYCSFSYDKNGKEISGNTKITKDTVVTAKWEKYEESGESQERDRKTVKLRAGEGYFGRLDYQYPIITSSYTVGTDVYSLSIPNIDDPDRAFNGWYTDSACTKLYPGAQVYSDGSWLVTFTSEVTDLYAGYGPAISVGIDANGGFFEEESYGITVDPGEDIRSNTYYTLKPKVSGEGFSLSGYSNLIRHDGDVVFGGWAIKNDKGELEDLTLTNTAWQKDYYKPTVPGQTIYAKWSPYEKPESLTLSPSMLTLKRDDTGALSLKTVPATLGKTQDIFWSIEHDYDSSSSSEKSSGQVIELSSDGTVKALNPGTVLVYAECNGVRSNVATVTVTEGQVTPAITIDPLEYNLVKDEVITVTASVVPSSQAENVEWTSSKTSVAVIEGSNKGSSVQIKAVGKGTAKITAKIPKATATLTVNVTEPEKPLTLDKSEILMTGKAGNTATLTAALAGVEPKDLLWASADTTKLSVTAGTEDPRVATLEVVSDVKEKTEINVTASIQGRSDIAAQTCVVTLSPVEAADAPLADPMSDEEGKALKVKKGENVTLTTSTVDSKIFYTDDGQTVPSVDAEGNAVAPTKEYTDAFTITQDTEIWAITYKKGMNPSEVKKFSYTIDKDNWGDINNMPTNFKKAVMDKYENDSNEVPSGVWVVFGSEDGAYTIVDDLGATTLSTGIVKPYTAEKVTFSDEINVFHNTRQLIESRDYTLTYKNNVAATDSGATVILKGKGGYSSNATFTFGIEAEDINNAVITTEKVVPVKAGKKKLSSVKPTVTYNGKKLTQGTDYTLNYFKGETVDSSKATSGTEVLATPGDIYTIQVEAVSGGNFRDTMTETVQVRVINPKEVVTADKLKVSDSKTGKAISYTYDGKAVDLVKKLDNSGDKQADWKVVDNKKNVLVYDKDFTVKPVKGDDLTSAGTHSFVIAAKLKSESELEDPSAIEYVGEKTFAFEITGTNFKNVKVAGLATTAEYKGGALDLPDLYKEDAACKRNGWNAVTLYANDGTVLKESTDEGATGDYLVSMDNTGVIGSFNITFTGVNKCTGTIKKTIKVNAASLADKKLKARNLKLKVKFTTVATYTKAGAKPPVTAALVDNKDNVVAELSENIDYTVAYKNNTKQGTDVAYVTLKGMGNYTGTSGKTYFTIEKAGVSQVQVTAKDVVYNPSKSGKSAYYRISAKLSDEGKTLTSGKEIKFNKSDLKYTYFVDTTLEDGTVRAQGTEIDKKCKDKIPAGTVIKVSIPVTATATGPYSQDVSEVVGYYRVVEKDISKVTVTVKKGSEYKLYVNNGEAVKLTKSDLEVKEKGTGYILQPEDYDIVSFTDNNKVGTAKLTIAGKGKYGNTKTQNIKIKAKSLK